MISGWIDQGSALLRRLPVLRKLPTRHWALRALACLIPLALVAAVIAIALGGVEQIRLGDARIDQVDLALKSDMPTPESHYCRRQYGFNAQYYPCSTLERAGYQQFARAWSQARHIGTWREQMIGCLLEAHAAEGISWAVASHCSESDTPDPYIDQQKG